MNGHLTRLAKTLISLSGSALHRNGMFGANFADDLRALVRATGRPIDTIFDVGANRGLMAKYFRRHFPAATIHCFEPSPAISAELQASLGSEHGIIVVRKALADKSGTADFYCRDNDLLSSLGPATPTTRKYPSNSLVVQVPVSTIDEYMDDAGVKRLSLIKIDTEGHEVEVLRGAKRAIDGNLVDHVYLEFNSIAKPAFGLPLVEAAEILEAGGYRFIATYTDSVSLTDGHIVANALFTRASAPNEGRRGL